MASGCGTHSTSPPRIATRHAAGNSSKWATTVAKIVPTRGRTTPPSSLQTILLSRVKLRSKAYSSLQEKSRPGGSHQKSRASGRDPTGEAVASFDTSGLFSGFEGASSENTRSSTFEIKEGPIQELGLWCHITGGLATSYHGLVWRPLLRLQRRDHQLGSAGTGDSDPHHCYPDNVGSCFGYGGYTLLRLAHPRQLPL